MFVFSKDVDKGVYLVGPGESHCLNDPKEFPSKTF